MTSPAILSIDIGSSSVRAGLYDYRARPLPRLSVSRAWAFTSTKDGASEMDAEAAFHTVCEAIDELVARSPGRTIDITHIAACSFWHSLLGVDVHGDPTTPLLGWADTRSRAYTAKLKKKFDDTEVHNRTGAHFHSSFWPAKLLWLRHERGEAFARTARWVSFGDYVTMRLTGELATSVSMASATGILDQRQCSWDRALLRYLGVRLDQLPQTIAGMALPLNRAFKTRWPSLKGAQLMPVIGDGAADHVGSCGMGEARASLMVGTSAAMRIAYEGDPPSQIPQGLWCYRVDQRRVIIGGALSDGGNLYEWCHRNFKLPANSDALMRGREPGAHGLNILPFFNGERSTGYREDARGEIIGITGATDGVDILQAVMESVAYRLAAVRDRLTQVTKARNIVASGGALRDSAAWAQIIADVLGRDLELSGAVESASRGTVLLALESIGKIDSIASVESREGPTLAFDRSRHAAYQCMRASHEAAISKAHGTQN